MVLRYNAVYGRANGETQLNNVNWPQYVSSIVPSEGDELAKGTYRPLLAPVNFTKFAKGSTFFTVWYAGPLSIHNNRGLLQIIPSNLQRSGRPRTRAARWFQRSRHCPITCATSNLR